MNFIEVPFAFIVVRLMMVFFYICNLFLRVYYSSGYLDIKINCRLKLHAHVQINFITVEILPYKSKLYRDKYEIKICSYTRFSNIREFISREFNITRAIVIIIIII